MLIAHFGDTHIRNLKYHKEYRENFSKIYEKLRELSISLLNQERLSLSISDGKVTDLSEVS